MLWCQYLVATPANFLIGRACRKDHRSSVGCPAHSKELSPPSGRPGFALAITLIQAVAGRHGIRTGTDFTPTSTSCSRGSTRRNDKLREQNRAEQLAVRHFSGL